MKVVYRIRYGEKADKDRQAQGPPTASRELIKPGGVCCSQERRCAVSDASEDGEVLDALENVVSYVPLLRGAQVFCQA